MMKKKNILGAEPGGPSGRLARKLQAFSLSESLVALALVGTVLVGMLGALNWVVSSVQWTRENAVATQVMEEKLETLRLYSWDQLNTPGYIQTNFLVSFSSTRGSASTTSAGLVFTGRITIATAPLTESYSNALKLVTVDMDWGSNLGRHRHAQMSTFVAQYGMQSFIY